MFGFQRRLVRRCECDTDMPHDGPLPHTSHTAAMTYFFRSIELAHRRPGEHVASKRYQRRSDAPPSDADRCDRSASMPRSCRATSRAVASRCAARPLRSLSPCPPLETAVAPTRCATTVDHVPRRDAGARRRHQPAERVPGARRRHRHQHGPHARRGRRRARRRRPATSTPTCDAISHGSLMGARGNSGVILSQILRGLAGDAAATPPRRTGADGRRGADGRVGRRVPGGAEADRGHDPHRRARVRRRRRARPRPAAQSLVGRAARRARRRQGRARRARPSCCRC